MPDFLAAEPLPLTNKILRRLKQSILAGEMTENNPDWDSYLILNNYLTDTTNAIIQSIVTEVDSTLSIVPRPLKSNQTLVAKLKNYPALQLVQDLAGIRIVKNMTLTEQTELANNIINLLGPNFHHAKDRREEEAKEGYRAFHVIAKFDKIFVEIQIRTLKQHKWADLFEQVADIIGRQIRYGEKPNGNSANQIQRRSEFVEGLKQWSLSHIAEIERAEDKNLSHETLLGLLEANAEHLKNVGNMLKNGDTL